MKNFLWVFLLFALPGFAQKMNKADQATLQNLKKHIGYLASDQLEGRGTGTQGEKLASEYIAGEFKKIGLQPMGEGNGYIQEFEVDEGKKVSSGTVFIVNDQELKTPEDYFPLPYSPNSELIKAAISVSLNESDAPWFHNIGDALLNQKDNPHFDLQGYIREQIKKAKEKGALALVLFNNSTIEDQIRFDARDKSDTASIPVIYLTKKGFEKYLGDESATYDLSLRVVLEPKKRKGHNLIGYIDNKASTTIVLGAHYDHLGYGEDGNSLLRTGEKLIHNGADDNASGTAALIEIARILKKSKAKKNNYLFISFSGEEQGLYGSKYFVEHPSVDLSKVNYMINMDMVGRLNDSSKVLTIGGFGTSPVWADILYAQKKLPFNIKVDSSGTGPSDHTSFYRKDIPVLFFFTGLHKDYHRPTDDPQFINYSGEVFIIDYIRNLVSQTDKKGKLAFTKTREQQTSTSARFSVSMGIMPDYTFTGAGVRVDGVSEGRPAQKAGIQTGDIVTGLGDFSVTSLESYMQALGKFKKGEATRVKIKRGNEEFTFDIVF